MKTWETIVLSAFVAGSVTVLIELGKWFLNRRIQKISMKKGLHSEIASHYFLDLGKTSEGNPKITLIQFQNDFYSANLSSITRLLEENVINQLAFYYAKCALSIQLRETAKEIGTIIKSMPTPENDLAKQVYSENVARKGATLDTMSLMNVPLEHLREELLNQLKDAFKEDPAPGFPLEVDEKHKEWWEKVTADLPNDKLVR